MTKSLVRFLGDVVRFTLYAALISGGYIACIFLAGVLGPVVGAECAPSSDPANPLVRFEEDPRTGDWFGQAKLAFAETGTKYTPTPVLLADGTPTGETVWVISPVGALTAEVLMREGGWRAGFIFMALLAGSIATQWLLGRLEWSRRAVRSLRTRPIKATPLLLAVAVVFAFGVGFYACGLLHEVRFLFRITDVDEFLPIDIAVLVGLLLGAARLAILVLVRRRYPLATAPTCWNCDYSMAKLPSPVCPECGLDAAPASPAPKSELRLVGTIIAASFAVATMTLLFRPGTAANHREIVDSISNSSVAFPPGQPIRIRTTDGTWVLDCHGSSVADESGIQILVDATCTLTFEGRPGQPAVTAVQGPLATQYTGPSLQLENGRLRVDVYRWAEYPKYFRVFVLGKATIEPVKQAKN